MERAESLRLTPHKVPGVVPMTVENTPKFHSPLTAWRCKNSWTELGRLGTASHFVQIKVDERVFQNQQNVYIYIYIYCIAATFAWNIQRFAPHALRGWYRSSCRLPRVLCGSLQKWIVWAEVTWTSYQKSLKPVERYSLSCYFRRTDA
jgi:hypothetical protein